jgi:hypothetical protein
MAEDKNDINASIIDQRVLGILQDYQAILPKGDANRQKSAAFVMLCISTSMDCTIEAASDHFTDGGQDAGVDGLHIGEVEDGEFTVTIFQGKYSINDLRGVSNFPENAVQKAVNTVQVLFDPAKAIDVNPKIRPMMEEIRSLVRDGFIPNVRMILCNNGLKWKPEAQAWIDNSGIPADQVQWLHYNHDAIVDILHKAKSVDDTIRFVGNAVIEDFNFRRVLIGKVKVSEIAELFNRHNDLLRQRNIRRYLGLHANRVNQAIHDTLSDEKKRNNFYFFNNGITIICQKFRHNALQGANYQVKIENLQIINGGQTCKTIQQTLSEPDHFADYENTFVMVRLYELAADDQELVQDITYATNSQNPVDLRDLHSNDTIQKQIEIGVHDLGFTYKRQRDDGTTGSQTISSSLAVETVLAVWRKRPHQAKFQRKEHFGKLYDLIFTDLNAAQAILAVLIYRSVDNSRKKQVDQGDSFIPYASHYLSMLIGDALLRQHQIDLNVLNHRNFGSIYDEFAANYDAYYQNAIQDITNALEACYGKRKISLQQLSATFRRGDLLEILTESGFSHGYR